MIGSNEAMLNTKKAGYISIKLIIELLSIVGYNHTG